MYIDLPTPSSHAALQGKISDTDVSIFHIRMNRLLAALLTVGAMLMLKRHYSLASADQLSWILAPTARLVAWFTPAHPVYEHGVGHVDFAWGIIIAPSCAGINFFIMAFGLSVCCGLLRMERLKDLLDWIVLSFACTYVYTLLINTLRIALSMVLYQADIYSGWLTAARLHRVAGVGIYLGALWLLYIGVNRFLGSYSRRFGPCRQGQPIQRPNWLPLVWYLTGAVGVPVANALFQQRSPLFGEHCITLVLTSVLLWGAVRLVCRLLSIPNRGNGCHHGRLRDLLP